MEGDKNNSGDSFLWLDEYAKALSEGFFRTFKNRLLWLGGVFLALFWLAEELGAQLYVYQKAVSQEISFSWKIILILGIVGLLVWLLSVPIRQKLVVLLNFTQEDDEKEKEAKNLNSPKSSNTEEKGSTQFSEDKPKRFYWKSLLETDRAIQKRIIGLDLLFLLLIAVALLIAAFPSGILMIYEKEVGLQVTTLLGVMFFLPIFLGAFLVKRLALIKISLIGFLRISTALESAYLVLRFNFTETVRLVFSLLVFYLTQGGVIFLLASPFFWLLENLFAQLSLTWFSQSSGLLMEDFFSSWELYPTLFVGAFFLIGASYLIFLKGFFVTWELDFWLWWLKRISGAKRMNLAWKGSQQQALMGQDSSSKEPVSNVRS